MESERELDAISEEIATTIPRYRASGLGLKAFALQAGLAPGRLHYWVCQKAVGASGPRAERSRNTVSPDYWASLGRKPFWVATPRWRAWWPRRVRSGWWSK